MATAYWAGVCPERPALSSSYGSRTFGELNGRANALVRGLLAAGVRAGDAVLLLCGNRPEFAEVVVARERGGLRLVPVNWHLSAAEIAFIVADSGARAVIADARFAATAASTAGHLEVRLAVGGAIAGFAAYEDVLAAHSGIDIADPTPGSTMLYTSGTTGTPKGVFRAQDPVTTMEMVAFYDYRPGADAALCTGPLYHTAVLAFSLILPLLAGTRTVLMDSFDAAAALRLIEQERITHSHMVPVMFHRLLGLPEEVRTQADVSSLRFVIHGAAPCPVPVKRRMMAWLGPVLWEYYAATEGRGTLCDPQTWMARPGTVGRPLTPATVVVGDEQGTPLPVGETGLLWILADPTNRFRYWRDDAKTAAAHRGDYFTLGDVGRLDEDGYLYLTDRSADLIISGGVNIYPAEVDAVLGAHPAVAEVATIGVPDHEWGENVLSLVELVPGAVASTALAEELQAWCRAGLAGFKCPRRIEFVGAVPRSATGKLQRAALRERYREELPQTWS